MRKRKSLDPRLVAGNGSEPHVGTPSGAAFARRIGTSLVPPAPHRSGPAQQKTPGFRGFLKGERPDSNRRPPGPQPGALPTELRSPRGTNVAPPVGSAAPL